MEAAGAADLLSRRYEKTKLKFDLSGRKTDFPIVVACLDGLGRLGGGGKIIRIDVRRVFSSHIDEKSGKPPKSFFDFLTLVIRHRFFFFVPETLNPFCF